MIVGYEMGHRLKEKRRAEIKFARMEQFQQWFLASAPGWQGNVQRVVSSWEPDLETGEFPLPCFIIVMAGRQLSDVWVFTETLSDHEIV